MAFDPVEQRHSGQHLPVRGARIYAAGSSLIWLFPAPFFVLLVTPGLWRVPAGVVAVGGYLGVAECGLRLSFGADEQGIAIQNQFRAYRLPWSEVREMSVIRRQRFPAVGFIRTSGGRRIPVQASGYSKGLRRTAWAIGKSFAPPSVTIGDGAPP